MPRSATLDPRQLTKSRDTEKACIIRIEGWVAALENDEEELKKAGIHRLTRYQKRLDAAFQEFESIQRTIQGLDDSDEAAEEQTYADMESKFCDVDTRILVLVDKLEAMKTPPVVSPSLAIPPPVPSPGIHIMRTKLPQLELPSFDGDLTKWSQFWDIFKSSIDSNHDLNDIQKLQYLKMSLKGEAARLLSTLLITDANYTIAKDLVTKRYEHTKLIARAHLQTLFSIPNVKTENAIGLRNLMEKFHENVLALENQKAPVEHWNMLLVHLLGEKMDSETRRQWEIHSVADDGYSYVKMRTFLDSRCRALEASGVNRQFTNQRPQNENPRKVDSKVSAFPSTSQSFKCVVCSEDHKIHACDKFKKLSVNERCEVIKKSKMCFNCFKTGHFTKECMSSKCKVCQGKHNTLLHRSERDKANGGVHTSTVNEHEDNEAETEEVSETEDSGAFQCSIATSKVLLATAQLEVKNSMGGNQTVRALLDSGSEASFITEQCANLLGLKQYKTKLTISGIGQSKKNTGTVVYVNTMPKMSISGIQIKAYVLPQITTELPTISVSKEIKDKFNNITLADPNFNERGQIDLLIGADMYDSLFLGDTIRGNKEKPFAHKTVFGWVLSGPVNVSTNSQSTNRCFLAINEVPDLTKFWELEEVPISEEQKKTMHLTEEQKLCEIHYDSTTEREPDGRFRVSLPFKDTGKIGLSKNKAFIQFAHLERKFEKQPIFHKKYCEFIEECFKMNHLEKVPDDELRIEESKVFYLPHHAVFKEDSTTTKLRVVFNGSSKSSSGFSLNDLLMNGPKIQDDLFHILLRFRTYPIAMTADVAKMYRQISLTPASRNFHRLLWRANKNEPIQELRFTRVIYGITSAGYHSIRSLQETAKSCQDKYPEASKVILKDFYVDDMLTGSDTVENAIKLHQDTMDVLKTGQLELRKWTCSNEEVLMAIPEKLREEVKPVSVGNFSDQTLVKALGIIWLPKLDVFTFLTTDEVTGTITKRKLLSDISRIFDPLGWVSPIVIIGKMILQLCWLEGKNWDQTVSTEVLQLYKKWRSNLIEISNISIPRYICGKNSELVELHFFCDASEKAYAACVYARSKDDNECFTSKLLCSKTKVAPTKPMTIPKLELSAAALCVRLVKIVLQSISLPSNQIFCWTDSTIVLSWIKSHPSRWKTFVANRVTFIQNTVAPENWFHVKSEENPADLPTRGVDADVLITRDFWWNGPNWLQEANETWKIQNVTIENSETLKEEKKHAMTTTVRVETELIDVSKFSNFWKLVRVVAQCIKFSDMCLKRITTDNLTVDQIKKSTNLLVKQEQNKYFHDEKLELSKNGITKSKKFFGFQPFTDNSGIIRVGGRLRNANIPFEKKHQIFLPKESPLTEMIVRYMHKKEMHAGPTLTLSRIRQEYWIFGGIRFVKAVISKCVKCIRFRKSNINQPMADLPSERVNANRPFTDCGVDYAGPVTLRADIGRVRKTHKGWIALFICLTTKAVHIEAVTSLSTDAFLATFRRFIARRGKPSTMHSDNGTNFVGASNELNEMYIFLKEKTTKNMIESFLLQESINWKFIPPYSPNFGGLWEAGVKSVKFHLRRVVGVTPLTYEELSTVLTQIESCLNSRPIMPLNEDPNEIDALTPGHFLVGGPLNAIPDENLTKLSTNRLLRWKMLQQLIQQFWYKWKESYLSELQKRNKWNGRMTEIKKGTMVVLSNDLSPPNMWKLGKITECLPGKDGIVRVVKLKVNDGIILRPVSRLIPLGIEEQNNSAQDC